MSLSVLMKLVTLTTSRYQLPPLTAAAHLCHLQQIKAPGNGISTTIVTITAQNGSRSINAAAVDISDFAPVDNLQLFFPDTLFDLIESETNCCALQQLHSTNDLPVIPGLESNSCHAEIKPTLERAQRIRRKTWRLQQRESRRRGLASETGSDLCYPVSDIDNIATPSLDCSCHSGTPALPELHTSLQCGCV